MVLHATPLLLRQPGQSTQLTIRRGFLEPLDSIFDLPLDRFEHLEAGFLPSRSLSPNRYGLPGLNNSGAGVLSHRVHSILANLDLAQVARVKNHACLRRIRVNC